MAGGDDDLYDELGSEHGHEQGISQGDVSRGDGGHANPQEGQYRDSAYGDRGRGMARNGEITPRSHELYDPDAPEFSQATEPLIPLSEIPIEAEQRVELHMGPLPDPVTLARYGEVRSDLPDRIVQMAEGQVEARNYAMRKTVDATAFATRAGAWVSVAVSIGSVAGFFLLALSGFGTWSLAVLLPAVLAGVAQLVAASRGSRDS